MTTLWLAAPVIALLMAGSAPGRQEGRPTRAASAARAPAVADQKPLALETIEVNGLKVRYRRIPCRPAASPDAAAAAVPDGRHPWLIALLQLADPVTLEGARMEAGDYALVCHPGGRAAQVPTVEIRSIRIPELIPDDPMVLGPFEGETLYRAPVQFDLARGTTPHLTIRLTLRRGRVTLDVRYGDWAVVKEFRR
jgi:hypothetical protein